MRGRAGERFAIDRGVAEDLSREAMRDFRAVSWPSLVRLGRLMVQTTRTGHVASQHTLHRIRQTPVQPLSKTNENPKSRTVVGYAAQKTAAAQPKTSSPNFSVGRMERQPQEAVRLSPFVVQNPVSHSANSTFRYATPCDPSSKSSTIELYLNPSSVEEIWRFSLSLSLSLSRERHTH